MCKLPNKSMQPYKQIITGTIHVHSGHQ